MDQQGYILHFENISPALANSYTEELRKALLKSTSDIKVQRQQPHSLAQSPNDTLLLILNSSAITVVAGALGKWLLLHRSTSLIIEKTKDGKRMELKNISSDTKEFIQLMEVFFQEKGEAADESKGDTHSP